MKYLLSFAILLCSLSTLTGQTAPTDSLLIIRGRITDAATHQAVAYASVYCRDCAYGGTITNENGDYVLSAVRPNNHVRIDHIMYKTRELELDATTANLEMQAEAHELPEVIVDGTEAPALVTRAYQLLSAGSGQAFKGEGFYRQTTRMNEVYSELFEYFVDVKYSNQGMADWKIITGRYAINPIKNRLLFENQSYYTRGMKMYNDVYDPNKFAVPINPAAYHVYDYRIEERIAKADGEIIVVSCHPTEGAPESTIAARLYISKRDGRLLRAEYTLHDMGLAQPDRGAFSPGEFRAVINFRATESGVSVMESVNTVSNLTFSMPGEQPQAVEIKSTFLNFPGKTVKGTVVAGADLDRNDLKEVAGKKYRSKWWDHHPVVAATPVEERVIADFNQKAYFGNYFEPSKK